MSRVKTKELAQGFWLKKVSDGYEQADTILRLAKASLALRGLEDPSRVQELETVRLKDQEQGNVAKQEIAEAARDWQLVGWSALTHLQTSRTSAVLQAFIARKVSEDQRIIARCPALFNLFLKAGNNMQSSFLATEPLGPLNEDSSTSYSLLPLHKFAMDRQASVNRQVEIITECISEASMSLFEDPREGLHFINVAEAFYKIECPLVLRKASMKILSSTAAKLELRL
eukprot:TRINITY_DN24427_c0_g1_i1.p1 TRINITY_DN24427_c0_g1~~TRINITY_DN24427_c0_g1_i1.p1  ORF type:complete len:248 (-),score=50.56 TRINITY_DN24427_c0_g1_i1:157-840(-)